MKIFVISAAIAVIGIPINAMDVRNSPLVADSSITTAKIADGAITTSKFNINAAMSVHSIQQQKVKSCATGVQTDSNGLISACVASDFSLKTAIRPIKKSGAVIDALRAVSYRWKPEANRDDGTHIGFIAQDVLAVSPASVLSAGDGLKGVDSNAISALLLREVQDLRRRVATLEKRAN